MDPYSHPPTAGSANITTLALSTPTIDSLLAAVGEKKQNLSQTINSISKTLAILYHLYQPLLLQRRISAPPSPTPCRNAMVVELDAMQRLLEGCNVQVPMEVLNLIDDVENLDEFTKDVLNSCIAKNQITKGKTDIFKGLRKHFLEGLEQTFPGEVEAYREI